MNPPAATYLVDSYRFSWPDDGIEVMCDRIHEEKDGLKCEMSVTTSRTPFAGLLREGRFNLSAPATRSQWVKALEDRMPNDDWYAIIEAVCSLSTRRWRDGDPIIDLAQVVPRTGMPYLIHPFVVEGAASVLFAEGGTGKSLFALALGLSVATGEPVLGVDAGRLGPVLYLDWEWDEETHAERLRAICKGAGIEVPVGMMHYRHEMASVWEAAPTLRRRIAELGVVFVIVDSLGMARGGEPESADLTLKTFSALRTFGVPVLCIDHVAKNATDKKHSFGSVYTTNAARMTWRAEAVKEEGANKISIGLTNQKANGRYQKPRGYSIEIDADEDERLISIVFTQTDMKEMPGFSKALTLRDHISAILRASQKPMAIESIHEVLRLDGIRTSVDAVRTTLNRNKGMFARGSEGWGMLSTYVPMEA